MRECFTCIPDLQYFDVPSLESLCIISININRWIRQITQKSVPDYVLERNSTRTLTLYVNDIKYTVYPSLCDKSMCFRCEFDDFDFIEVEDTLIKIKIFSNYFTFSKNFSTTHGTIISDVYRGEKYSTISYKNNGIELMISIKHLHYTQPLSLRSWRIHRIEGRVFQGAFKPKILDRDSRKYINTL